MSSEARLLPLSEAQAQIIREQLRRITESEAFAGSKRCQEFLEFIVERGLSGDVDGLRERAIGAELFNRPIDYETATDPIVRVKANDVRRRLARYNLEAGDTVPVRILLPSGSYVPQFCWRDAPDPATDVEEAEAKIEAGQTGHEPSSRFRLRRRTLIIIFAAIVCALVAATLTHRRASALEAFWRPALENDGPVLICFGRTESVWLSQGVQRQIEQHPDSVSFQPGDFIRTFDAATSSGNIRAALSVAGQLQRLGKTGAVRWVSEVQPEDFRHRSVVLIGAFNNPWTMDMNRELRFSFEQEGERERLLWVIRDRQKPGRKWTLSETSPQPITHEYAILTRIIDHDRRRVIISGGGMNHFGTQVAGEFLSDEAFWEDFARTAPSGWERRNLQVVLEMDIAGNRPVHPRVIGRHFW